MDKIIKRTWWNRNKTWVILASLLTPLLFWIVWNLTSSYIPEIVEDKIKTGNVEFGEFQEIILASGFTTPKNTVIIDANEGGTVQEIHAEEGDMVKAGDILLSLENETLMLDYMQRETQMVEQINNLRNTRINLHQNLRTTEDQLSEYQKQLELAANQYEIDSILSASNGLALNQVNTSRINYEFLHKRVKTLNDRRKNDTNYQGVQIERIDNSISLMERNLEMIREKLNEMSVKAPISGQLNSFNIEPGQVLLRNQTVGRVDEPGKFWLRALVDQHYLNRLNEGQGAHIDYDNKSYPLTVSKVLPTVQNGQIELYLDFNAEIPDDLRRGQNFQVYIEVSAKQETLKIPKGSFFQSSGGHFVYVLTEDRKRANKRSVKLGRQNPSYYEVTEGLNEGEEIIISSYDYFKEANEVEILK